MLPPQPIIPVLDLLSGEIVRGVAGRRNEYRPIVSSLVASSEPRRVAHALHRLGLNQFYLADLDAIGGAEPNWPVYHALAEEQILLWIDAGLCDLERAEALVAFGKTCPPLTGIIVGLESLAEPALLSYMVRCIGSEQLIFSLDLQHGTPLTRGGAWKGLSAEAIARKALEAGVRRLLVLDMAQVGLRNGISTTDLCHRLRELDPDLELISGGGVRDLTDVQTLWQAGCNHILVASALHDGHITSTMIETMPLFRNDPIC